MGERKSSSTGLCLAPFRPFGDQAVGGETEEGHAQADDEALACVVEGQGLEDFLPEVAGADELVTSAQLPALYY